MTAIRNIQAISVALFICATVSIGAESVAVPLTDFLNLNIQDRYTEASEITKVTKFAIDVDGDGSEELFLGHPKLWHGDNTGLYCAVYSQVDRRFIRLTPADSDIRIDQRFFGDRATTFVGYIDEVSSEGVLVLTNEFFHEDWMKFDSAKVYSIAADKLVITDMGSIDRTTKEGQRFYDRYFGKDKESRSIETEEFSTAQLQELGYKLPSWKQLNTNTDAASEASSLSPSPEMTMAREAASHATEMPAATVTREVTGTLQTESESPSAVLWLIGIAIIAAIVVGAVVMRRKVGRASSTIRGQSSGQS